MKNKTNNNKNFLSKLFVKIIRKFGYEIIDQANLEVPTNDSYAHENLSKSGNKSTTIPLGSTKITNKVNSLTIIIRSYTSTKVDRSKVMLDQNKDRIFKNSKIEYTLRTINSLIKSCNNALKDFKNLNIKLLITDDNSSKENLQLIKALMSKSQLKYKIFNIDKDEFKEIINKNDENGKEISLAMISNMRNILKSVFLTKTEANDLVYFVEDDYLHNENAISEMLFTYEKIASQLEREIFLCPADYPYLYKKVDDARILLGHKRHWRTVNETLITFLTSKKMILKYWENFVSLGTIRHHPMEKKLHEIYEKEFCLSPIPSLAMHATNINSAYGIPPNYNWKKNWEDNKV